MYFEINIYKCYFSKIINMRYSSYLLFSTLFHKINTIKPSQFIKNINMPSCKKCIHFNPDNYNTESLSKCNKFGEKNIISNEIKYDYADSCRKDEEKCGLEGKCFEKETDINLRIKTIKHQLSENSTIILTVSFFSIYIISYLYVLQLKYTC
jgi:hypothetical protein